ncbi:MAG: prepilin-type N-terminal cleavage/methylation domain-containing protein [Myxococcales bacterium]|nr:prepilin-type N-terminal cleavage/methylation domain-containing protein [Myxococcales bacterium]MCB9704253.1 prepilin-type N-terminal cleavage/methylation domain-containing protein [Myxococcales bacterium]
MGQVSISAAARRGERGFSIIELLVVLAVVGLLVGSTLVGLGSAKQAEIVRATNQVANTIRFAFNKSRVTGDYYRLLINIDQNTIVLQRGDDRMYLPATDRDGRPLVFDPRKAKEREERDKRAEEAYNRSLQAMVFSGGAAGASASGDSVSGKDAAPSGGQSGYNPYLGGPKKVPRRKPPLFGGFEEENSISGFSEPIQLPPGVRVVSVRTAEDPKAITKGEAGIYFFPQGRTQLAHVQLEEKREDGSKDGNKYTVIVQPLTGRVEIADGLVDLVVAEDIRRQRDELGREQDRRAF